MAHGIEIRNGVASFAENGKKERAWHNLGEGQQIFDRPMLVKEALEACHANYKVGLKPVVALNDELIHAMENGEMIDASRLQDFIVKGTKATMRSDMDETLGIVSEKYGIVQNEDAFKFVDMFCSGNIADRDNTPVIETCGVLGHGERVFVTAKFPKKIVLNAKRDDIAEMYVVFTTSHDGTGAVKCICTPVRVVCNNTLQLALGNNIGRLSFRHTSGVGAKMDLLNKENAEFAYKMLNLSEVYENDLKQAFEQLSKIKVTEDQVDDVIAKTVLSQEAQKVWFETRTIWSPDIKTRGRNIFIGMKNALEDGIGQEGLERGTAEWVINGITTYYQNSQNFKDEESKFDSILNGNVSQKVQMAYDTLLSL